MSIIFKCEHIIAWYECFWFWLSIESQRFLSGTRECFPLSVAEVFHELNAIKGLILQYYTHLKVIYTCWKTAVWSTFHLVGGGSNKDLFRVRCLKPKNMEKCFLFLYLFKLYCCRLIVRMSRRSSRLRLSSSDLQRNTSLSLKATFHG